MKENFKILMCEDDESLGQLLKEYFQDKGYSVDLLYDGEAGFKAFMKGDYDFCLLDVMMPKKDGFSLAKDIRIQNPEIPIVFLTAKCLKEDVIKGFQLGADDYVTKPFSMEELYYRVEALMRRVLGKRTSANSTYKIGDYSFDSQKRTLVFTDGTESKLTTKESDLLLLLVSRANDLLERNVALKSIWVDDNYFNARSMDVYITRLRHVLSKDPNVEIINIHGKGYKLAFS